MNDELRGWLTHNRELYEFYLLHAMLHDPLRRSTMLAVPVVALDFRREEYGIVVDALTKAVKIMGLIGDELPSPPSCEFMRSYLELAAREQGSDDDMLGAAERLVRELQDPSYTEQYYCIYPYFEAWYGSVRAKVAARDINRMDIPDVQAIIADMQRALEAAAQASGAGEEDEMDLVVSGEAVDRVQRRPTGIAGLDLAMNGGWGVGECSLVFSGSGGGKSLLAGQCAWHEADTGGWPLIVSTELRAREYVARIVSAACEIDIALVQDCGNFAQIREAVLGCPGHFSKQQRLEEVLATIAARLRVAKVSPDETMDARAVLEREAMIYESKLGHRPTWVCLDWLGSMADLQPGSNGGTAERAMMWEHSANSCVRFADVSGIPTVVLAQGVNDCQGKHTLVLSDIAVSKGIGKGMVTVIGITNAIDVAGVKAAAAGKADMPKCITLEDQHFCVCKARKGEGVHVPVRRQFRFQRFVGRDAG